MSEIQKMIDDDYLKYNKIINEHEKRAIIVTVIDENDDAFIILIGNNQRLYEALSQCQIDNETFMNIVRNSLTISENITVKNKIEIFIKKFINFFKFKR